MSKANTAPEKVCPRTQLRVFPIEKRNLYFHVEGLREMAAEYAANLLLRAQQSPMGGDPWARGNYLGLFQGEDYHPGRDLHKVLAILEATPEYRDAKAELEPLLAACAELDRQEEDARRARAAAAADLEMKRAAALDAAAHAAEESPEVIAARRKLESLPVV